MNAIERKFYDGFLTYVSSRPFFSVQDVDGSKIADCQALPEEGLVAGRVCVYFEGFLGIMKKHDFLVYIDDQEQIGPYKVDFIFTIEHLFGINIRIAIEIDGHEWHEKNKAQAMADKKRDRFLLASNTPVMRFTGSEVYTNAISCVQEVLSCSVSLLYEKMLDHHEYYVNKIEEFNAVCRGEIS